MDVNLKDEKNNENIIAYFKYTNLLFLNNEASIFLIHYLEGADEILLEKFFINGILLLITPISFCPASWGSKIYRLHHCRGIRPPPLWMSWYGTKQSDGEVPVMLELWGMWSIPSLTLLSGPLRPGMVAPNRALSMD